MAIKIDKTDLLQVCREIIETILACLPNAWKGTVYRIGNPPDLTAKEIASGTIDEERKTISWGIPERSRFAPPGKPWMDYRNEPGRPLEPIAWCVENQKGWTAENGSNERSAAWDRSGDAEEVFHHMEPVLIHKKDLYINDKSRLEYPLNYRGETIWQDSDYIVADVIKIQFRPNTIKPGSPEIRVIRKLSQVLGKELLALQFRQLSLEAMRRLAEDKQHSCDILADSIRNAVTKSGLILSLIKLELEFLREQWEGLVLRNSNKREMKRSAVRDLNRSALSMERHSGSLAKELIDAQNRFLEIFPSPERGRTWITMQIEEKWKTLLSRNPLDKAREEEIFNSIDALKQSLYLGKDKDILENYNTIPEARKKEWVDLLYTDTDRVDFQYLDGLIRILDDQFIHIPYRSKSRKSLIRLKVLAEIMGRLEQDTNVVLTKVLKSHDSHILSEVLPVRNRH
ncbi:MAG: hypothetical protein DRH37_04040 [Deltaproteobacteria bacterium]|nr:MAG: hypothetical protein DRH37_04040 [Deltaproteobacteria bacterium]